ncbi:MAG: hypothetical protein DI536_37545 [Archangium gephyra]|uniref:Transposase IS66 central domain-containing protein n=1 Tax=Archangium gephyra TaxID=48 RepID=A0A2W5SLR4_9BACT|nr:MAG: hypothetical protein DI536_37545 [Archangium gephyra]
MTSKLVDAPATAAVDGPVIEVLTSALAEPLKHADGTTWHRHHAFRSLWVLATRGVTVFTTFESGTKVALSQWLGNNGILVSDRGTQPGSWSMRRRQICWAHLLRKFAWYAVRAHRPCARRRGAGRRADRHHRVRAAGETVTHRGACAGHQLAGRRCIRNVERWRRGAVRYVAVAARERPPGFEQA